MFAPTARRSGLTWIISATLLLAACSGESARPRLTEPSFGKTPAAPAVTSTTPSYGYQGSVNVNVTINGSGFDGGTRASWYLNGSPYPKITVNSTSYVSSSQLVANISIASDAEIQSYDVVVTTSTTKQGIGSDCFMVTLAVPIPIVGYGINMAGQVVGQFPSNKSFGALWDPRIGMVALPNAGAAFSIDENGATISGQDNANPPAVWTSVAGAAGPWTETILTLPTGLKTGRALSIASDVNGHALFIAGNYRLPSFAQRPVVWTRTPSNTWQPQFDTLPTGVPAGWAQSVNAKGQSAGMDGSAGYFALYWDSLGTATTLSTHSATAWSINGDGTVVVGSANGVAAMWTRTLINGVYGPWSGDTFLDTPSSSCSGPSSAFAVNAAGTVAVGKSCGQPVAWNIAGSTITRFLLGTLGQPNAGTAFAINNLAMPNAAGGAGETGSGFGNGVLWKSF